ncbi:MAG: alkaline phosphatase D family protein [Rhodospirillaceae bacterium]|nr:alkaline phosphatase D family protein [Rhodospirillaceae bacterium]
MNRRELIAGAVSVPFAFPTIDLDEDLIDPHPARHSAVRRIAFGSCAHQDKPQPIWDRILEWSPDLFIFLGDTIYGDGLDPAGLRDAYRRLGSKPSFRRFRDNVPIVAMWDDHDFGANDSGREYAQSQESKAIFLDFFGEAALSQRRTRDGVQAAYVFGSPGASVHVVLPDLRMHRSALKVRNFQGADYSTWAASYERAGQPVPGPYDRQLDAGASMLNEAQWMWLERQMMVPATTKIFASSLQVLADFPGWEAWVNFPRDRQRLLGMIDQHRAEGIIFVSGDTHYGEISRLDRKAGSPLWDITSSGLTEIWATVAPNSNRIGTAHLGHNFGTLDLDWQPTGMEITAQIHGADGEPRLRQRLPVARTALPEV